MYEDIDTSRPYNPNAVKDRARKEFEAKGLSPGMVERMAALRAENGWHEYQDAHDPNYNTRLEPTAWMKRRDELRKQFVEAADPERTVYMKLLEEWHDAHGTKRKASLCAGCGDPIKDGDRTRQSPKATVHADQRPTISFPFYLIARVLMGLDPAARVGVQKALEGTSSEMAKLLKTSKLNKDKQSFVGSGGYSMEEVTVRRKDYDRILAPIDGNKVLEKEAGHNSDCLTLYKLERGNEAMTGLMKQYVMPPPDFRFEY